MGGQEIHRTVQNCVSLWDAYGAGSIVWKIAQEADASALYAMGEGGFLSALWQVLTE